MTITEIRMFRRAHVRRKAYKPGADQDIESTIVEIVDDAGRSGWGEACILRSTYQPINTGQVRAGIELAAPALLGVRADQPVVFHRAIDSVLNGSHEARAALDIACFDLAGKQLGRSVGDLLGGAVVDRVPTYLVLRLLDGPEAAARGAAAMQDDGVTKIQIKAADGHVDTTIESVHAIAEVRRPGTDLFVDANRAWTIGQAIAFSEACRDIPLAIEQPCDTYAECADARRHLRHPLILDECATDLATAARAITAGVANAFGMKICRLGGLAPMRAFLDLCRATNTPTSCDDAWGGDIIAAACVHAASTLEPRLSRGAWIPEPYVEGHYDDERGPRIEHGTIAVPTGPGLGLQISDGTFGEPIAVWNLSAITAGAGTGAMMSG